MLEQIARGALVAKRQKRWLALSNRQKQLGMTLFWVLFRQPMVHRALRQQTRHTLPRLALLMIRLGAGRVADPFGMLQCGMSGDT